MQAQKKEGKKKQPKNRPDLGKGEKSVHVRTSIHVRHFPDLPGGEITIEGNSTAEHCTTHSNRKKSSTIKMGLENKRGESIVFKKRVSANTKEVGKKKQPKIDPILVREKKSVRTVSHGRHVPDLPFGEITIEGSSSVKHCTIAAPKKNPRIKMGFKKKRREHCSKIE